MQTVKMVISGAVNAGKTEFIKAISEIEVVSTERRATDDTKLIKKETTVAMDLVVSLSPTIWCCICLARRGRSASTLCGRFFPRAC